MSTDLKTDSPTARRIVIAFLHFLDSVEPARGVDVEALEVAKECLQQVFQINPSSTADSVATKPNLLLDFFTSLYPTGQATTSVHAPAEPSTFLGEDWTRNSHPSGVSKDELFGIFFNALERIHYFRATADGNDDPIQLEKATRLFRDALTEMEKSGCNALNQSNLAEALKSLGNRAMQSKKYSDAIELYNCAIGLCENNAVYYCNRAAAYTHIHKYTEAIKDCLKSIEIDPNYSKAYSRLGLAYYGQGNYRDAIDKGFTKALQLDPNNEAVKENIQVAEQKLKEGQQRTERDQSSTSQSSRESQDQSTGGSRNNAAPPPFNSMPFNTGALPPQFANMFMNIATNAATSFHGPQQHSQDRHGEDRINNVNGPEEPEIHVGGNISFNLGDQMPEELTGALRSVMQMFTGQGGSHGNQQDTANGRPGQG